MADYRAFKDSWSVNSFKKRFEKGEINFDNPINWTETLRDKYNEMSKKGRIKPIYNV